jgi:hypothetical protein
MDKRPHHPGTLRMMEGMRKGIVAAANKEKDAAAESEEPHAETAPPSEKHLPQAAAKLTRNDLTPYEREVEGTWRRLFPDLVKGLEKDNSLYEMIRDAVKNCMEEEQAYLDAGWDPVEAHEEAERVWILTPDA